MEHFVGGVSACASEGMQPAKALAPQRACLRMLWDMGTVSVGRDEKQVKGRNAWRGINGAAVA